MDLEGRVKDTESKGFMRKAGRLLFKGGVAIGTTLLSTSFVGPTGILVGGALALGSAIGGLVKRKSLYDIIDDSLSRYSTVNAIISPIIWLGDATFPLIEKLVYAAVPGETLLARAAQALYGITAYNAAFVGMFRGAKHLIDNYLNPAGMWKSIKDNFYNDYFRIGMVFLPGYALAAWGVPPLLSIGGYGIPNFAPNAFFAGFYNAVNPLSTEKTEKQYLNPLPGLLSTGKKAVTGIFDNIYNIGSAIAGAKVTPPAPAQAVPQPA